MVCWLVTEMVSPIIQAVSINHHDGGNDDRDDYNDIDDDDDCNDHDDSDDDGDESVK